jgi:hypothetical protein
MAMHRDTDRTPKPPANALRAGKRTTWSVLLAAGALWGLGCTGSVDGNGKPGGPNGPGVMQPGGGGGMQPGGGGGMQPGGGGGGMQPGGGGGGMQPMPTPVTEPPSVLDVGVSGLRRLTADQYRNTVRDLLGLADAKTLVSLEALPADGALADRFTSNVDSLLQGSGGDQYADAAATLAARAVTNLGALAPCAGQANPNAACAQSFIEAFGKRAFRRPLTAAEVDRYKTVFTAGGDFKTGVQLVLQTFLQSPKFLYLVEVVPAGDAGKVLQLDSWAMASRLSYFFLNSMPDDKLFAAAEANALTTPEQVAEQAGRLMADARFQETLSFFHDQWLEVDMLRSAEKDAALFKGWSPEVKAALEQQLVRFVQGVLRDGDGRVETLLTASYTYLNGPLYDVYGLPRPATATDTTWAKVDLDPRQRAGLLTHAGLLAGMAHENRTSYILRGKMVREGVLCTSVPPPPPGVDASEMNIAPTATAQERSRQHRVEPACASCHELFDPLGFGFEIYDAMGRYRTTDAMGKAIDSSTVITATDKLNGTATDAVDLVKKLGGDEQVRACVSRQWLRFALGREPDDKEDASTMTALSKAAGTANGRIPDMLTAIARSNAFRHFKVRQ